MRPMEFTFPVPPSVNHYWRRSRWGGMLICREGRAYRNIVAVTVIPVKRLLPLAGRLKIRIRFHPPDNRRRDLDNVFKALLDAMEHAGVYDDDSQIDHLSISRADIDERKLGGVVVTIETMPPVQPADRLIMGERDGQVRASAGTQPPAETVPRAHGRSHRREDTKGDVAHAGR